MDRELGREEFYAALGGITKAVDDGFRQVNARLDRLNGKTERHGEEIAALKAVQDEPEPRKARDGRKDGAIGGAIAAGAMALIELARYLAK